MIPSKVRPLQTVIILAALFAVSAAPVAHANPSPIGWLDGVTLDYRLVGWTLDPGSPEQSLEVHFYVDGAAGHGVFVGAVVANLLRPDVNDVTGYAGDHGFSFEVPEQYRSGYRFFYAYGTDSATDQHAELLGSPKTIGVPPNGDATISAVVGGSPLVIRTFSHLAGAIGSLTWRGQEFIDRDDHGRELQSASSFDNLGECYNPTEAGSSVDGPTSTSILQALSATANVLTSQTQMAFWLLPGIDYRRPCSPWLPYTTAQNSQALSNHLLNKRVTVGFAGLDHVIEYLVIFTIPADERHDSAVFEVLTGYMQPQFSSFWKYNPATRILSPLDYGPEEQDQPVIMATPDGNYAMGVYSPDLPQDEFPTAGYGRWSFIPDTVKWNCVFRKGNVTPGQHSYRCYVVVGTLGDVQNSMDQLHAHFVGDAVK